MIRFIALICLVATLSGCKFIEPGYVGIKVNSYGNQRGVEDFPIKTGRVPYNIFTETVYEFPTFMQNRRWTAEANEAFTFSTKEGAKITASVGLNYSLDPDKVPALFVAHRSDLKTITDSYVRTQLQKSFTDIAGKYSNIEIMGAKQEQLLREVQDRLASKLASRGFLIDNVAFIGAPEPDARVAASINSVIEATQEAQKAEAKVAQVAAEAKQAITKAQGEADAIAIRAKAESDANLLVAKSITHALVSYEQTKKWNGVAPRVQAGGSGNLLLNVGTGDEK